MSEKEIKKDPLLDADEGKKEPGQEAQPKAEAKPEKPAEVPAKPKETPVKTVEANNKDTVAQTKEILAKKPHVNFIIPVADGEPEGASETVSINGYQLTIKKGVMVNIPLPVANILAEKYRINMEAGKDKRIDRASDVSDALS